MSTQINKAINLKKKMFAWLTEYFEYVHLQIHNFHFSSVLRCCV